MNQQISYTLEVRCAFQPPQYVPSFQPAEVTFMTTGQGLLNIYKCDFGDINPNVFSLEDENLSLIEKASLAYVQNGAAATICYNWPVDANSAAACALSKSVSIIEPSPAVSGNGIGDVDQDVTVDLAEAQEITFELTSSIALSGEAVHSPRSGTITVCAY